MTGDLTTAMTIIADKLGMSIQTVYDIELQMQQFKGLEYVVIMIALLLSWSVIIYIVYKRIAPKLLWDGAEAGFICVIACVIITFVILILNYFIYNAIIHLYFPQYAAMKDTIDLLSCMVP